MSASGGASPPPIPPGKPSRAAAFNLHAQPKNEMALYGYLLVALLLFFNTQLSWGGGVITGLMASMEQERAKEEHEGREIMMQDDLMYNTTNTRPLQQLAVRVLGQSDQGYLEPQTHGQKV